MSAGCKPVKQYGVSFRFLDISEEKIKAHIQKAVPEKSKIATKNVIKIFIGKKKKEFEVSI